ncbi:transposase, MuDR, MULE transposase domain protein, partial [Tanacetum coccineum]
MNTIKHETPYGNCSGILKKGDDFDNKEHCMYVIGKKALDEGFEFKVRKSTTLRFDVICKNAECKWKIISSKSKNGDSWLLGTVNDIHTCSRTQLNPNHRNATKKLLGWLLAPKLKDYSRIYKPKDIINDINLEFNIDITYKKAWGGKNKGLEINSGCPLDSFSQLPCYFSNLKMVNKRTVTHIEIGDEGRFKMCFIAFGFALSGIPYGHVIAVSRKMGCIDYSHLALGWFRKTTLYSTYQDLVYPMGEPSSWVRPDGLQVVKPPNMNFHIAGRPKNTDRIKSQGEEPIQ